MITLVATSLSRGILACLHERTNAVALTTLATTALIAGLSYAPALADSAMATDQQGKNVYSCSSNDVNNAKLCALSNCERDSGGVCTLGIVSSPNSGGYAAAAQSLTEIGFAVGYNTQEEANRSALSKCAQNTSPNDVCRVVLTYQDKSNSPKSMGCLNPATGLPMVSGECWGVDIGGNPYGTKLH